MAKRNNPTMTPNAPENNQANKYANGFIPKPYHIRHIIVNMVVFLLSVNLCYANNGGSGTRVVSEAQHPLRHKTDRLVTNTTNFDGVLSATDDTVQKALDTLDGIFQNSVQIDGDLTIGDGTNYSTFASNGRLTMTGTARAWRNEELTPVNVGLPSSNPPAEDEYLGFTFDRFDRGTDESIYYLWTVPHCYATGDANVRGFFQFFVENPPSGTGNEAVVMGFEYKKISDGDVFSFASSTTGTLTEPIVDGEAAYTWHYTPTGTCTTTGWEPDDTILFRFFRDADNVDDTYDNEAVATDNDVWVGVYHVEYLTDSLGEGS